jgi:hypothetical protein
MTENLPEKKKTGFRLTVKRITWLMLLLVWVVGLLMLWYGQTKLAAIEVKKQEVQKNSLLATQQLAKMARELVLVKVRPKIKSNDLGSARTQLENAVDLMEVATIIAIPEQSKQVGEIKTGLQQSLDLLVSDANQADSLLDEVGQKLNTLSGD